jgi:hypothetical protein
MGSGLRLGEGIEIMGWAKTNIPIFHYSKCNVSVTNRIRLFLFK